MATLEELEEQLNAMRARVEQEDQTQVRLTQEAVNAGARQRLRREIDTLNDSLRKKQRANQWWRDHRTEIDQDTAGPHLHLEGISNRKDHPLNTSHSTRGETTCGKSEIDCKQAVFSGVYEWKISGMSWLKDTLEQASQSYVSSRGYWEVAGLVFDFIYCPWPERAAQELKHVCTLALNAWPDGAFDTTAFRYRIYIKSRDGEYALWGDGHECKPDIDKQAVFGPDVTSINGVASGIFGLNHEELLQSEWVQDDALSVKFELEVRPDTGDDPSELLPVEPEKPEIEVLATSMRFNFLSMFENEKCTDLTFNVKGVPIKAHSQVLAARSEVFERQFFGGLQESSSKEVVIEDVEPIIFKAFLKCLYTDDSEHVKNAIIECLEGSSSSSDSTGSTESSPRGITKVSLFQDILAMSHKYQVLPLLRWCERELCNHVTVPEVCSMLCQAHLCEAHHLEATCLRHIKEHMRTLAATPEFVRLTAEWPEVLLKISLHSAGLSSAEAAAAVSAGEEVKKRKRES